MLVHTAMHLQVKNIPHASYESVFFLKTVSTFSMQQMMRTKTIRTTITMHTTTTSTTMTATTTITKDNFNNGQQLWNNN
jgi:hypothetical protein